MSMPIYAKVTHLMDLHSDLLDLWADFSLLVHGYSRVLACKDDELDYIYFEANRYGSEKDPRLEYILPIDEKDSKFDLTLIEKLVAKLNKSDQEAAVSK